MKGSKKAKTGEPGFPIALNLPPARSGIANALQSQLRTAIVQGRLPAGLRLPATRKAAVELGIGRNTVIAVYDRLIAEGYVRSQPGAAPVVSELRAPHAQGASHAKTPVQRASQLPVAQVVARLPLEVATVSAGIQSFRTGVPDARYFPYDRWRQLSQRTLRQWARKPFAFPPTEGLPELREAISNHVGFARAVACNPEDVIVTTGARQAFDLLARVFAGNKRCTVAVEQPGYPPLAQAFAAAGANLIPVAVDDEGLCVDRLPPQVDVICVTPSHQSPLGVTMSHARRRALLDYAERCNAIIIEDDYDGEYRFGARPLDALQSLDTAGRVFYVGTFSKSMFPALRTGFVIAPHWARDALIAMKSISDPHCNDVLQATLAAFIQTGELARHVRRMQRIYAERRAVILSAIAGPLASYLSALPSEAGLHLAARWQPGINTKTATREAHRCLPGISTIADYAMHEAALPGLVFGYGCIEAGDAKRKLAAFAKALR